MNPADVHAVAARIHTELRIDHRVYLSVCAATAAARAAVAVLEERGVIEPETIDLRDPAPVGDESLL